MATQKGFIKDYNGNKLLPITRGELVLDAAGMPAFHSSTFLATDSLPGLLSVEHFNLLKTLTGDESGNYESLYEIYNKLNWINTGIKVGNTTLNFYNTASTPITFEANNPILVTTENNKIKFALNTLTAYTLTEPNKFIKSIEVDGYGRVTNVTQEAITNADLPATLSNKILDNCTTSAVDVGEAETSIVNKKYVDDKFNAANSIASGALKFKGSVSTDEIAKSYLTINNVNNYYKATSDFTLSAGTVYEEDEAVLVKSGDTLIVYNDSGTVKFVLIPSGDDFTTITVLSDNESTGFNQQIGDVRFNYDSIFNISASNNVLNIALPQANTSTSGFLSSDDWNRFNGYAAKSIEYSGNYSEGNGIYEIGTLTIGDVGYKIKGINNISALTLENGNGGNTYNPILKFTETNATDVNITFSGINGVVVKKNGNNLEFEANNTVAPDSTDYLEINKNEFKVKIGTLPSGDSQGAPGLVDINTFYTLTTNIVKTFVQFEAIDYSLRDSANAAEYRYGNIKLQEAVNGTEANPFEI